MKRPGMMSLLAYLSAQPGKPYLVIFDDLKRFARDTEFRIKLRRELAQRGARIECLNFNFEDSPEGRFVETIIAAQGQLEREQNRRQVVQKMKARVEKGYYVFHPPVGYRYARNLEHGKLLVRDEPLASIITEVLEGFASGRFSSQSEVKRFLEPKPDFPKSSASGDVRVTKVRDILERPTYAGYVEAPNWGVSLRKGFHEALIDYATHERVLARLHGTLQPPARKDINEDFPLRDFVLCDDCGEPMTSCWSKGRNRHYAYYLCDTPDCASRRKSIPRVDIEDGARAILRILQPASQLFEVARVMFRDLWNARLEEARNSRRTLADQLKALEKQIDGLLDRIVDTDSATVAAAYKKRIEKLEREKRILADRVENAVPPPGRLNDFIEPALLFLSSPWKLYDNGIFALKRTVLKLAFVQPLRHNRKEGYRTAKITFPFKVLADFLNQKCRMVEPRGIEPLASSLRTTRSTN